MEVVYRFELYARTKNVSPGARILDQGEAHFRTCSAHGFDVFDLGLDRCEVTHMFDHDGFV